MRAFTVVLDTVVFVRALINPFSAGGRLTFQYSDRYRLVVSKPLLQEVLEVLGRPEITKKFRSLQKMDIARILDVVSQAEAADVREIPSVSRDINDDMVLATAKAGHADYIVSQDKDLLDLGEYDGIQVVDYLKFIGVLEE